MFERDDPPRMRWRGRLTVYLPAAVGVVLAVAATSAYLQVVHPFLAQDDWDTLLPVTKAQLAVMRYRLLAEGRWLNFAWWRTAAQVMTPVTASVIYFLAHAAFVVRLARKLAAGWWGALVAAALFASPMMALLSAWPAVLTPSMVVLAVSTWTLPLCRHRFRPLLVWMALSAVLAMLSYQPVLLVLLVVLVVEELDQTTRHLILVGITFCATWVASVLVMFTLNWIGFGVFGLRVQAWRQPNPVRGVGDLVVNLGRVERHLHDVGQQLTVPLLLGLLALAVCIWTRTLRKQGVVLLVTVVVAAGLESSGTVVSGILVAFRVSMWVWVCLVVAVSWLAQLPRRHWRLVSAAAMAALAVWGAVYGHTLVSDRQARLAAYDDIDQQVSGLLHEHPGAKVMVVGSRSDWANSYFGAEAQYLNGRTRFEHGVRATYCYPAWCPAARDPSVLQRRVSLYDGNQITMRPPPGEFLP
jgi:hypothetical protein